MKKVSKRNQAVAAAKVAKKQGDKPRVSKYAEKGGSYQYEFKQRQQEEERRRFRGF